MSRRCSRKTTRATGSTTWRRRTVANAVGALPGGGAERSAGWRWAAPRLARPATSSYCRRTSPRRTTSTACRSARAAARSSAILPTRRRVRDPGSLAAIRNENVEGLSEPHELELTLDGHRLDLFTIKPNRNAVGAYYADEAVDKDLKIRVPVPAGPHELGVTFPGRPRRCRKPSASRTRHTSTWTGIRESSPRSIRFRSPDRSTRADPPTRRAVSGFSSAGPQKGRARRQKLRAPGPSSRLWRAAPTGGQSPTSDLEARWRSTRTARSRRQVSTPASRWRFEPFSPAPSSSSVIERDPRNAAANAYRSQRSGPRLAAVLFPVEQHSGRGAARPRRRGASCTSRRCWSGR